MRTRLMVAVFGFAALQQGCDDGHFAPREWTRADIRKIRAQLEKYHGANGRYPTEAEGLKVLGEVPHDWWKHEFIYRSPGRHHPETYDLLSAGPDFKEGTADDVWNE